MANTRTIHFSCCWINLVPGWTQTGFYDGTEVVAVPENSAEYRALAARLGYGNDLEALSREHEILHSFLTERSTGGASPTLWAVAHGQDPEQSAPPWEQEYEEERVLAFQHLLNGGAVDVPCLCGWADYYQLDLKALEAEARNLLRGPGMEWLRRER
ncbi:MAG: hypothetical protein OHK0029_33810 [Armatimonadaceae bacterium]